MPLIKYDNQTAAKLWSKLADYSCGKANLWFEECVSNREFYEGIQYTSDELEKIAERGQYNIVINKIRKAIKGLAGLVTSSIPKYKLIPVGKDDDTKAMLGNKILDWVWNNSDGLHTYRSAVKAALIDNMAYLHVHYTKDGKVKFSKLSFDDVLVDPVSKHPLFDDAEMMVIKRYVPVEHVKAVYGLDVVTTELPNEVFATDINFISNPERNNFLAKVFDASRRYVNLYECYKKRTDQVTGKVRIVKETVIGYMDAYVEDLPEEITEFPLIPIYVEGYDNPYKRGEVYFLKDIQKFINKTYGVTIYNAQMTSTPKVFLRENAIPRGNIDAWKENYNAPGSINLLTADAEMPTQISGQPLNNAFFNLYQDANQVFEWLTVPNQILGFGQQQYGRQSDMLDIKESAMESLKDFIAQIDLVCSRLGYVCLQYVQAYVKMETLIHIPDNKGAFEAVELNKKQGLDVDNEESVKRYINHMKQQRVPEEEIQGALARAKKDSEYVKDLYYILNDTNFSNFDVRVIPGSYSPTYQMALLRLMMEMVQTGAVDPSVVLEYAPVENREELKERFDTINMQKAKIFDLEEENKMLKQSMINTQNSYVQASLKVKETEAGVKIDKLVSETKIKLMRDKFQSKLNADKQRIDLEQLIREIIMDVEHELFLKKAESMMKEQGQIKEEPTVDDLASKILG